MKKLLLLAVLAAAVAVPASASAGKPVRTLTFTPGVLHPYIPYEVAGCGYPASTVLTLEWFDSTYDYGFLPITGVTTDPTGCFALDLQAGLAGTFVDIQVWHGAKMLAEGEAQTVAYP